MPLYASVDRDACIACGLCQMLAPQVFDYDQDGLAFVRLDGNTGTHALSAAEAIDFKLAYKRCPTGAIKRHDQPLA